MHTYCNCFFYVFFYASNKYYKFTNFFFYIFISDIQCYNETRQNNLAIGKIVDLNFRIFEFNIHKHKISDLLSHVFFLFSLFF